MPDYNLSNMKIIVGDLKTALSIDTIILTTKKVIYTTIKKKNRHLRYRMSKMILRTCISKKYVDIIQVVRRRSLTNNIYYCPIYMTKIVYILH